MSHADEDYAIVGVLFTVVFTGEQNQLAPIKSKNLTSAFVVS